MLSFLGPPNVEKLKAKHDINGLIKALGYQKDASVRKTAAQALGQLGDVRAVEPLNIALKDPDWLVRYSAAETLGKIGDPRAVIPLISALRDSESSMTQMRDALGRFGDARDMEEFLSTHSAHESSVRAHIVEALGRIGDARALEALISALSDGESLVRVRAAQVLGQFSEIEVVEALIAALKEEESYEVRSATENALIKIGSIAKEPLVAALQVPDISTTAAELLGRIGDAQALEPLAVALKHSDNETRRTATLALKRIGSTQVVEPLLAALKDTDSLVRKWSAEALGEIKDKRAVEPLIVALKDKEHDVRSAAAEALGRIKDKRAVESLIVVIRDGEFSVCMQAAEALGRIKDKRAAEPLVVAFKDSESLAATKKDVVDFHEAVVKAVKSLGDPRAAELSAALKHERTLYKLIYTSYSNQDEIIKAIKKLGEMKDPRTIEWLLAHAIYDRTSPIKASAALDALIQIADTRIVRLIVEELESDVIASDEALNGALRLMGIMLDTFLGKLSLEDLQTVAHLADRTRYVSRWYIDRTSDEGHSRDEPVSLDLSRFRKRAERELKRRGLET